MTARIIRRRGADKPIIALALDGSLADTHGHFLRFAALYFGKQLASPHETNPGLKPWHFLKITRAQFDDCWLAYELGAMKRSAPCLEGASAVTARLQRDGCEVWLTTARRTSASIDRVDADTLEWIRRNGIKYDALIYEPRQLRNKYKYLRDQLRDDKRVILGCAEDVPEQALWATKMLDVPVWMRNSPNNQVYKDPRTFTTYPAESAGLIARWDSADELLALAEMAIELWRLKK